MNNNNTLLNTNVSSCININKYLNTSFHFSEYKHKESIAELLNKLQISLIETLELFQELQKSSNNSKKLLNEIRKYLNENVKV